MGTQGCLEGKEARRRQRQRRMITKIATSQGIVTEYGENAAVELGRMGGKAWAAAMTAKKH
jgi:hypothetical protein